MSGKSGLWKISKLWRLKPPRRREELSVLITVGEEEVELLSKWADFPEVGMPNAAPERGAYAWRKCSKTKLVLQNASWCNPAKLVPVRLERKKSLDVLFYMVAACKRA